VVEKRKKGGGRGAGAMAEEEERLKGLSNPVFIGQKYHSDIGVSMFRESGSVCERVHVCVCVVWEKEEGGGKQQQHERGQWSRKEEIKDQTKTTKQIKRNRK